MTEGRGQKAEGRNQGWERVYISFGSNLGDREGNIKKVLELIKENPHIKFEKISLLYETEPVGKGDQDWFLNQVIEVSTNFAPQELLGFLMDIEDRLGRKREEQWGPRTIDLDILLFNDRVVDTPELKIPHPEIPRRNFVLVPLAEIAPEAGHPVLNKSIEELLLESPDDSEVRRWQ
jgi:2-amino-4-hydroxy-6-hydroxymethyldihydropteridine diphosphokinase